MFLVDAYWYVYWDKLGKGLEEICVNHLGFGQREKGDHSRFLALDLGVTLGDWSWSSRTVVSSPSVYLLPRLEHPELIEGT